MAGNKLAIIALLISVAVNLVFVGGIAYRASTTPEFGPRPFPPNVGWVVRDLSEERRAELEPILRQSYEEIRPLRGEMLQALRRVNELMASPDFDAGALAETFAGLRAVSERYQTLSHEQTIAILDELSEAERRTALEFMQRRGPREGLRRDNGRPGFGPGFRPGGRRTQDDAPPPLSPDL